MTEVNHPICMQYGELVENHPKVRKSRATSSSFRVVDVSIYVFPILLGSLAYFTQKEFPIIRDGLKSQGSNILIKEIDYPDLNKSVNTF